MGPVGQRPARSGHQTTRRASRFHSGDCLVTLTVHDAQQRDATVLYDDVDRIVASGLGAGEPRRAKREEITTAERVAMSPQQPASKRERNGSR